MLKWVAIGKTTGKRKDRSMWKWPQSEAHCILHNRNVDREYTGDDMMIWDFVMLLFSYNSDPCTFYNSRDYQETLVSSNSAPHISWFCWVNWFWQRFSIFSECSLESGLEMDPYGNGSIVFSRHDWWIMLSIILDLTQYIRASHFLIWLMTPGGGPLTWAQMSLTC